MTKSTKPTFIGARRAVALLGASLVLLAACEAKLPTSAEVEAMDASSAVKTVTGFRMVDSTKASYTIDGNAVSKEVATSLKPGQIATINVSKINDGSSLIEIRTLANAVRTPPDAGSASPNDSIVGISLRTNSSGQVVDEARVRLRVGPTGNASTTEFDGLILIDGKISSPQNMKSLSPDRIESVEVVKGKAAAKFSDPRAANGVIIITTKKL